MAAHHRVDGFRAALVFHLLELRAGNALPVAHGKGQPGRGAGRGKDILAGICFGVRAEFVEILPGRVGTHHYRAIGDHDPRDVGETVKGIARAGGLGQDQHRSGLDQIERVAVRPGLGRGQGSGQPAAARLVHHHHGLPQALFGELGPDSGREVAVSAGPVRHDELDGFDRITAGRCHGRQNGWQKSAQNAQGRSQSLEHSGLQG